MRWKLSLAKTGVKDDEESKSGGSRNEKKGKMKKWRKMKGTKTGQSKLRAERFKLMQKKKERGRKPKETGT